VPDKKSRVVIIGAGQAGYWVASTIRQIDAGRDIVMIGDEPHLPYERPPLSKGVLTGKQAPESAAFKPAAFYADNRIGLKLGTRVTSIDRAAQTLALSDGTTETYDTLAIATGLTPRRLPVPGADHPGVVTLRHLGDVAAIRPVLAQGKHLVAIGAGFIGLEIAAAAVTAGAAVTVIEAQPQALGRVIAREVAAAIVARHERHGVRFRFGETVSEITDRARRPLLRLGSGESLEADLVLVGIGAAPNDGIARDAGIGCDDGVLVDETGITSDPHVYAAGDVCRQFSTALGRTIRLESWQNAQNQAIAVGKRIAGAAEPHHELPWFWTDQYDFNFQIAGLPESWDEIIWRGAPGDERFTAIYLEDGRVVAANTFNNGRDIRPLTRLILGRNAVDPDLLADLAMPLARLQKMQAAQ